MITRIERHDLPVWARCAGACLQQQPVVARVYFENGWMLFLCAVDLQRYVDEG